MNDSLRRRRMYVAAFGCIVSLAVAVSGCSSSTQASGASGGSSSAKPTIALTMAYTGNAWGKSAEAAFVSVAKELKAEGKIAGYYTSNANNSASTQSSQINGYVLKHVSAIIVEPSSPTGLNNAIARAHAAHIPVISIETGPVTSPYSYELNPDVGQIGSQSMQAAIDRLHGKGNVLYMQGVAGNPFTVAFKKGVEEAAKKSPGINLIVGPFGNWTDSTSQSALSSALPSMPKIDAVISEGGEYGAVQAIVNAGRPVPVAIGDNYGAFMKWWWDQHQKTNGKYDTVSMEANPWVAGAAVHVAMHLHAGAKLPQQLSWPLLVVNDSSKFKDLTSNEVASQGYDEAWVKANVEGGK